MDVKQVIIVRNDIGMSCGKIAVQVAHASIGFLTKPIRDNIPVDLTEEEIYWIHHSFTKICVCVNSEEKLNKIYDQALNAGIKVSIVIDSGKTEFHGEPTATCIALGPDLISKIDEITGNLELL